MSGVTIKIINDSITPTMQALETKFADMGDFVEEVGMIWSKQMSYNFNQGGWPPLAAATIAAKAAAGWPLEPLIRTGEMHDAAVSGAWEVSGNQAILEVPGYSGFHFDGTSVMPARDYAFIPTSMESEIQSAFDSFINV